MPDSCLELDIGQGPERVPLIPPYLHVVDGVLCYRDRIVIPAALQGQVLAGIHAAHQGVFSMAGRIDETVFWPWINPDILRTRGSCMTITI